MSVASNKNMKFICDQCETQGNIAYSDFEYKQEGSEGGMGARIEH